MAIGRHDAELVKPHALMLFQELADNLALDLWPRRFQDLFEGRCIAPLDGGAGAVLVYGAFEIAAQMAVGHGGTGCRRGQGGKN